jgi:ATP-binding cassette subfamily B protein
MSPRFVPATVHELARVPLFSGISGKNLAELAGVMRREQVAPGASIVTEGEEGDRFYVVLSGVLAVSQEALGPRRVLRPGDTFGEVALAMDVPRTASVRAMTPVVVASCDREGFDRYVRPLFAEDEGR